MKDIKDIVSELCHINRQHQLTERELNRYRELYTKYFDLYYEMEKENKKIKKEMQKQLKEKDKEIQLLLNRIELWKNKNKSKTTYKSKKKPFEWDKECRYYKKCKNRAIKECDICKQTGIYKGESL